MAYYCIPPVQRFPSYQRQGWNQWNLPVVGVDGPYHTIPLYYVVPIPPQVPIWQNNNGSIISSCTNTDENRQQSFPTYNMWSSHPLACLQNLFARSEGSLSPDSVPTLEVSHLELEATNVHIQQSKGREDILEADPLGLEHNKSYAEACKKENTGTANQSVRRSSPWSPAQSSHSSNGSGTNKSTSSKRKRRRHKKPEAERYIDSLKWCPFCRGSRSKSPKEFFKTHPLRGPDGLVICPILSKLICPKCGATGAYSHTLAYCPFKQLLLKKDELLLQALEPSSDSG